jgi:hypothetical protein
MEAVEKINVTECWALHYHIYNFFEKGGNLKKALKVFKTTKKQIIKYFYKFFLKNKLC